MFNLQTFTFFPARRTFPTLQLVERVTAVKTRERERVLSERPLHTKTELVYDPDLGRNTFRTVQFFEKTIEHEVVESVENGLGKSTLI